MNSPLLSRLIDTLGWPLLDNEADLAAFLDRPGLHCLFVPGDPQRNLETNDAAVILPELRMTFQNAFDCALVGDGIETAVRERYRALKTPGFVFLRETRLLGAVQKVRDWDDYLARVQQILATEPA